VDGERAADEEGTPGMLFVSAVIEMCMERGRELSLGFKSFADADRLPG
jgi:hypothetical protein